MTKNSLLDLKRILIVDDEEDVLDTLADLLPMCNLTRATNFEDAATQLDTRFFDIAILDIMGVDGYQVLEKAKEKGIISVMLTAHALSPEDLEKSYVKGADSYIPKEEMANIKTYLIDILEALEQGKSPWWRWMDRLGTLMQKRFGKNWKPDGLDLPY